jgi:hypothetical protein
MIKMELRLGQLAKDIVTGFMGTVTAKVIYLTGCTQYCLSPTELDKDGKLREGHYFDEQRVELVHDGLLSKFSQISTGGPQDNQPSH